MTYTLISPHLRKQRQYQRSAGRKRFKLCVTRKEFLKSLWPDHGLTWGQAVSICCVVTSITKPGEYDVDCGTFIVIAERRKKGGAA
jgi:hypothetical protein